MIVARWESRSGKHWVEVDDNGTYDSPSACGARTTVEGCIEDVQKMVEAGYFQPDAAKTPMKRVK